MLTVESSYFLWVLCRDMQNWFISDFLSIVYNFMLFLKQLLVCSCWHNVWYPILIETADIIYLTDRQFQWEKRVFFNCIFTSDLKAWLCFICGVAVIWAPVFTFSAKIQPKWRFRFLPRDLSDTEMWKESKFYVA